MKHNMRLVQTRKLNRVTWTSNDAPDDDFISRLRKDFDVHSSWFPIQSVLTKRSYCSSYGSKNDHTIHDEDSESIRVISGEYCHRDMRIGRERLASVSLGFGLIWIILLPSQNARGRKNSKKMIIKMPIFRNQIGDLIASHESGYSESKMFTK